METKATTPPATKTDASRFVELYQSLGVPLKMKAKDGMIQVLLTGVKSDKFKFVADSGSVVWFHLDGRFAKQVFYAKPV